MQAIDLLMLRSTQRALAALLLHPGRELLQRELVEALAGILVGGAWLSGFVSLNGWQVISSLTRDASVRDHQLMPGTRRRVFGYAAAYKTLIIVFLVLTVIDSLLVVASPLILQRLIDNGVIPGDAQLVITLAVLVAVIAVADAALSLVERWLSARIGEGLIYDLRTEVFGHVLRQPIAFFTRAQTGALVTRLNSDVIGASSGMSAFGRPGLTTDSAALGMAHRSTTLAP